MRDVMGLLATLFDEMDISRRGYFFFRRFLLDKSDTMNKQLLKDNYSFTSSPLYPTRSSNGFAES